MPTTKKIKLAKRVFSPSFDIKLIEKLSEKLKRSPTEVEIRNAQTDTGIINEVLAESS